MANVFLIKTIKEHIPIGEVVDLPGGKKGLKVRQDRHGKRVTETLTPSRLRELLKPIMLDRA